MAFCDYLLPLKIRVGFMAEERQTKAKPQNLLIFPLFLFILSFSSFLFLLLLLLLLFFFFSSSSSSSPPPPTSSSFVFFFLFVFIFLVIFFFRFFFSFLCLPYLITYFLFFFSFFLLLSLLLFGWPRGKTSTWRVRGRVIEPCLLGSLSCLMLRRRFDPHLRLR